MLRQASKATGEPQPVPAESLKILLFNLKTDADDDVLGFTTDWINALARYSESITVITMNAGRIDVASNVWVHSVGAERGYGKPRRLFEFYRVVFKCLKQTHVSVCFAHMMPLFAILAWPMLTLRRIPILLWYAHKSVTPMLRIATTVVDGVVSSSRSGFQIDTPKLRIIGQGIDTERFAPNSLGLRKGTFTILVVARLAPIKRLGDALEIMSRLKHIVGVRLRIVGAAIGDREVEYMRSLRSASKTLGITELIEFVGARRFRDVHTEYQHADCFLNPSETDSVDKTGLEAMSSGLPIITSNIAFSDVLGTDLASQWVVSKGDIDAFVSRIQKLIGMTVEERASVGAQMRAIVVNNHSLDALARKVVHELQQLKV